MAVQSNLDEFRLGRFPFEHIGFDVYPIFGSKPVKIWAEHGGGIRFESAAGKGTEFILELSIHRTENDSG